MEMPFGLGPITALNHQKMPTSSSTSNKKSWASVAAASEPNYHHHIKTHPSSNMDPKSVNRGFLRLDSLEGPIPPSSPEEELPPPNNFSSFPSPSNSTPRVFDRTHHTQRHTDAEAKWFSTREEDRHPNRSHTHPSFVHQHQQQLKRNGFNHPQHHHHRHSSFHHHPHHRSQWRNQERQRQQQHHQHHHQVSFQTPLNLMTGRFEIWPTATVVPAPASFSTGQAHYHVVPPQPEPEVLVVKEEPATTVLHASASVGSYFSIPEVCNLVDSVLGTLNSLSSRVISNLNPNARAFTPLNPNAKEFQPAAAASTTTAADAAMASSVSLPCMSSSAKIPDNNTPPCKEEAKETKPVSLEEENAAPSSSCQMPIKIEESKCLPVASSYSSTTSDTNTIEAASSVDSESYPRRLRSFSSCSSTSDDGIEFSGSPSPKIKGGKSPTKKCLFDFYNSDDESEESEDEDDEEDDDDSDEDWDEVDGEAALVDIPDEFKSCGLVCPIQSKIQAPAGPATKRKAEENEDDLFSDDEATATDETFPGPKNDFEETRKRLEAANSSWISVYGESLASPSAKDAEKKMRKSVSFSHPNSWLHVSEDPELSEALKAARSSDFSRRKADLARLERTLAPVLDPKHREKVYQRLYGSDAKDS